MLTSLTPRTRALLLAFIATFFWSFNVIIAASLAHEVSPLGINFWRWAIAGAVLLPFTLRGLWQERAAIKRAWKIIFSLALLSMGLRNPLVYQAAHTASVIDIALLGALGPVFLAILSRFWQHTSLSWQQIGGMTVCCTGVLFIISHGNLLTLEAFNFVIGDLLMLIVALLFAVYSLVATKRPHDLSPMVFLMCTIIVVIVSTGAALVATDDFVWIADFPQRTVLIFIYMGIFPSLVSYACWNNALVSLGAVEVSLVFYTIPIMSAVEAAFLLGAVITPTQIFGGLIVLSGIAIANIHFRHRGEA